MPPTRIVSLVPSLTELVWWLGAGDRLVGRTKFCTEPRGEIERVQAVGGTKNPDVARIVVLRPDLVIANREENRHEDVAALEAAGLRVLLTDPNTVDGAVEMIRGLGVVLGTAQKALELVGEIEVALADGRPHPPARSPLNGEREPGRRVYVGVWHNPMMGLGSHSYGHSLLEACGALNVLGHRERYPEVTLDELRELKPELILLPDEPFPFDAGHVARYSQVAPAKVIDGKLLWWYGPRMPTAIRELRELLGETER